MSDFEIVTYASHNAPEARRWIAYISTSDQKDYWPIRFYGDNEEAAKIRARAHYASCEEKREKAIKGREEARQRMKDRAAKKETETAA